MDKFIDNLRRLKPVNYDDSPCVSVNVSSKDIQEIGLLSNLESNVTEQYFAVVITMDKGAREKFGRLKNLIKSDKWIFTLADDINAVIALIKQDIAVEYRY